MIGLVLEKLSTHKKTMSPWWVKKKMINIVKFKKEILAMVVMKMVSMITKSTKWVIDGFTILLMRKVLWGKIVRFVEKMSPYALQWWPNVAPSDKM